MIFWKHYNYLYLFLQARSLFQKNPNGNPGKWWLRNRFPKVAKPVLGESLNMEHLMPTHISRDTIVKFHDRTEFLEVSKVALTLLYINTHLCQAKHFMSKNSHYMGKRNTRIHLEDRGSDHVNMYTSKEWKGKINLYCTFHK